MAFEDFFSQQGIDTNRPRFDIVQLIYYEHWYTKIRSSFSLCRGLALAPFRRLIIQRTANRDRARNMSHLGEQHRGELTATQVIRGVLNQPHKSRSTLPRVWHERAHERAACVICMCQQQHACAHFPRSDEQQTKSSLSLSRSNR